MIRYHAPLYPEIPCTLGSAGGTVAVCPGASRVCGSGIPCLLGGVAGVSVCPGCSAPAPCADDVPCMMGAADGIAAGGCERCAGPSCPWQGASADDVPRRILPTPGCMACKYRR